jgi:hypothetical protein
VKGGSGVTTDNDNPTRTHAEDCQAERSGQTERSGEGVRESRLIATL